MSHEGEGEGEDEGGPKKSERKRQREKQRRTDLSNAFDELAGVLSGIEPEDMNAKKRRKKSIGEDGDGDAAGMTRLDLVVRTIDMLKKLHTDNEDLRRSAPRDKSGEQEVLVMVPTLTSVADSTQNRPPYPPYYPPLIPGQQLGSNQQSDPQSEQGQSQKHPYPQTYQQQYYQHQHYQQQQHPYQYPSEREQSPPQHQDYPGNPGAYYAGLQGRPYGHCWGDEAGQYSNRGDYAQYSLKNSQSRSHDEDEERNSYAKK